VSRLWKRLKGPHSPHRIAAAVLVTGVALASSALIARGFSWLGAGPAAPLESADGAARPPVIGQPLQGPPVSVRQIGEQVLLRNIFDSTGGPMSWELAVPEPPAAGDATESDGGSPLSGARCNGDLRLLASVMRSGDRGPSIAALRKDGKTHILGVGERVGELELVAVYPTAAYFRDGAQGACSLPVYLSAHEAPLAAAPPPSEPAVAAPPRLSEKEAEARAKRPPTFSEEELKKHIRVLGPARYAVTRELFTRARMNPSGITRGARFKAVMKDGRSSGMQIAKLRDDSLLAHLGVKQGDVLRGLNGFSLGSGDGVLEAFGHLGKKSEVALAIERDGAPTMIQYVLE
jgi:hypothetical protein